MQHDQLDLWAELPSGKHLLMGIASFHFLSTEEELYFSIQWKRPGFTPETQRKLMEQARNGLKERYPSKNLVLICPRESLWPNEFSQCSQETSMDSEERIVWIHLPK